MTPPKEELGLLKPVGGGDPIPLRRPEMTIGRRPSCDIRLPFENISGKHCQLRLIGGVWHVRDLGSTNKTTVNGLPLSSDHAILPEDELGIAGHLYTIEYEPRASAVLLNTNQILDEELVEAPKRHSLMELAGLEGDSAKRRATPRARADRPTIGRRGRLRRRAPRAHQGGARPARRRQRRRIHEADRGGRQGDQEAQGLTPGAFRPRRRRSHRSRVPAAG